MEYDDNCICAEWDGKGWSVCGVPCSVHWKSKNGETIEQAYEENHKAIQQIINAYKKI